MISNILDIPADQVKIGMEVQVFFVVLSEEISLPKFRPAVS